MNTITTLYRRMKRTGIGTIAFLLFLILTLGACSDSGRRFTLKGRFKNINQGEFYLIDLEHGTKDTLKVNEGRFAYETVLSDTAIMALVFPNFSELPVIAQPGGKVSMKGDVSHLKETKVTGTDENEMMTDFRMKTASMVPPDVKKEAEATIRKNPKSVIGRYLLRRHFLTGANPDYQKAYELSTLMKNAQPENIATLQLHKQLESIKNLKQKGKLPSFKATDTEGRTVDNKTLNADVNVVCLWATWNYTSQNILRTLKNLQKNHPGKISVISVCVDASDEEGQYAMKRDSLKFPKICDGNMWDMPIIKTLGLAYVPDNIVTDKNGNIIARSLDNNALKEKIEKQLK